MKHFIITIAMLAAIGLAAWSQGGNKILWIQDFPGFVNDCAFMPDEDFILIVNDSILQVRKTVDQSLIKEINFMIGKILKRPNWDYWPSSFDISDDGRYIAVGGGNFLMLLDINTFLPIKEYQIFGDRAYTDDTSKWVIKKVDLSSDSKKIACVGYHFINILDVETGKTIFQFGQDIDFGQIVNEAIFSPDGKWLACDYSGGTDKKIYVFDTETWKVYAVFNDDDFTPNGAGGSQLIFSPNSEMLLAAPCAKYVFRLWDLNTKQVISNAENVPKSGGIFIFFKDSNTLFWSSPTEKSYFYKIKESKTTSINIMPPIARTSVLNKNETLLLGDMLCLTQIDRTILSTPNTNSKEKEEIIYPNPTTGEIHVNINLPYNALLDVNIIDLTGKIINKISSEMVPSGKFEMSYNVSYLPSGVYLLKFTQRDFEYTFKLVKEGK